MKHKFALAVVATLSLLCGTVVNAAGNDLPITHGNKYTISRNGGGGYCVYCTLYSKL